MKRLRASIILMACVPLLAVAGVSGKLEKEFFGETKTMTVNDGYAFNAPDSFDKTKQVTLVFLTEKPFPSEGLDKERDRRDVIGERLRELATPYIELSIGHEYNTLDSANLFFPGEGNLSTSGNTLGKLTRIDAERVAGELSDSTIRFDLPIAPPPVVPKGVALSADGGEPGAAFRAYHKALAAGDVDALASFMEPEKRDMMLEMRSSPDFAEQLQFLQEMNSGETRISGGEQFGDSEAILQIEGVTMGEKFTGEVTMKKGAQGWYIDKESRSF